MTDIPKILLADHLKTLKLPTFLREYEKLARQCAAEGLDHVQFLARLVELELIDRERRMIERRIKAARFPATKSLPSRALLRNTLPGNGQLRLQGDPQAQQDAGAGTRPLRMDRPTRERHRLGAQWNRQDPRCPRAGAGRLPEGAAGQLHHRRRAGQRDDGGPRRTSAAAPAKATGRHQIADHPLSGHCCAMPCRAVDELGFVPLSKTGAELLFELISQRYERGSTMITSNLPFDEWTETFGTERLTGALLDRLTHHVNILEMNGDSYRLGQSRARKAEADT